MACMSLWMGVPVVSLSGNCHAGRMVASVLASMGLEELVAADRESYIQICSELAMNSERLKSLRYSLRELMGNSSLRDEKSFTQIYEREILKAVSGGNDRMPSK